MKPAFQGRRGPRGSYSIRLDTVRGKERSRQVWLRILSFLYWGRDGHHSVEVFVLVCVHHPRRWT